MAKKFFFIFFNTLDPKDSFASAHHVPMSIRSKMPILLSRASKFFHFSRDFLIVGFQQQKWSRQKWPIFGVQYLFRYLLYQNDTYRGFSTWTYVCSQKKFLKLANFISIYPDFGEISRIFKKNCFSSGGSLRKWSCPTSKNFKFFWTSKTYL